MIAHALEKFSCLLVVACCCERVTARVREFALCLTGVSETEIVFASPIEPGRFREPTLRFHRISARVCEFPLRLARIGQSQPIPNVDVKFCRLGIQALGVSEVTLRARDLSLSMAC